MRIFCVFILCLSLSSSAVLAEFENLQVNASQSSEILIAKKNVRKSSRKLPPKRRRTRRVSRPSELSQALALAKAGKYEEASQKLFKLSVSPRYKNQRNQIKYILGLMLYQMKFNQLSAFQFITVIKNSDKKYLRQSLEKLSLAADALGDDTLLNYAISRVDVRRFPKANRDILYYRIGEYQLRAKDYSRAASSFKQVGRASHKFTNAKYLEALAYAEQNQVKQAIDAFNDLYDSRANQEVTDPARVSAQVGLARAYYQGKQWDRSIEIYREVPRDTEIWHDTLFESSWAMLRSGRFRSALSNFQTLHSEFYEDFYLPESLLLRAIVYLYICKYDEMEKVLNLFNKIYLPVYKGSKQYLTNVKSATKYYDDVTSMMAEFFAKGDQLDKSKFELPFIVGRKLYKEGDVQRGRLYIQKVEAELQRLQQMPSDWRNSSIGKYGERVLTTRLDKAKKQLGRKLRRHLVDVRNDLFDLFEQEGFIRFEMINGKKEILKKRVAGKNLPKMALDEATERDYFVQNGYQYWPFQGEFWLDELGNYHYLGTQSCE